MTMDNNVYIDQLDRHADRVMDEARALKGALLKLKKLGRQGTWLGSRKLGPETPEFQWTIEVARLLVLAGFRQKTGGGEALMAAPHKGCHLANRPDHAIACCADFLTKTETPNQYVRRGGHIFSLPTLNSRHDTLFFGSEYHIALPGRLGTMHELYDLLNRLKLGRLLLAPVYLVERDGFYSRKVEFLSEHTPSHGPRVSPEDYSKLVTIIDLTKVTPAEFVQILLRDIGDIDDSSGSEEFRERAV